MEAVEKLEHGTVLLVSQACRYVYAIASEPYEILLEGKRWWIVHWLNPFLSRSKKQFRSS